LTKSYLERAKELKALSHVKTLNEKVYFILFAN